MPKIIEALKSEKDFGQCSACFEMTTIDDPCCPMAGVLINGYYVSSNEKELIAIAKASSFGDGEE